MATVAGERERPPLADYLQSFENFFELCEQWSGDWCALAFNDLTREQKDNLTSKIEKDTMLSRRKLRVKELEKGSVPLQAISSHYIIRTIVSQTLYRPFVLFGGASPGSELPANLENCLAWLSKNAHLTNKFDETMFRGIVSNMFDGSALQKEVGKSNQAETITAIKGIKDHSTQRASQITDLIIKQIAQMFTRPLTTSELPKRSDQLRILVNFAITLTGQIDRFVYKNNYKAQIKLIYEADLMKYHSRTPEDAKLGFLAHRMSKTDVDRRVVDIVVRPAVVWNETSPKDRALVILHTQVLYPYYKTPATSKFVSPDITKPPGDSVVTSQKPDTAPAPPTEGSEATQSQPGQTQQNEGAGSPDTFNSCIVEHEAGAGDATRESG